MINIYSLYENLPVYICKLNVYAQPFGLKQIESPSKKIIFVKT